MNGNYQNNNNENVYSRYFQNGNVLSGLNDVTLTDRYGYPDTMLGSNFTTDTNLLIRIEPGSMIEEAGKRLDIANQIALATSLDRFAPGVFQKIPYGAGHLKFKDLKGNIAAWYQYYVNDFANSNTNNILTYVKTTMLESYVFLRPSDCTLWVPFRGWEMRDSVPGQSYIQYIALGCNKIIANVPNIEIHLGMDSNNGNGISHLRDLTVNAACFPDAVVAWLLGGAVLNGLSDPAIIGGRTFDTSKTANYQGGCECLVGGVPKPKTVLPDNPVLPLESGDCPCKQETIIKEITFYLSPNKNSEADVPVQIPSEQVICGDTNTTTGDQIPCDEVSNQIQTALQSYSAPATTSGLGGYGYNDSNYTPYFAFQSYGYEPPIHFAGFGDVDLSVYGSANPPVFPWSKDVKSQIWDTLKSGVYGSGLSISSNDNLLLNFSNPNNWCFKESDWKNMIFQSDPLCCMVDGFYIAIYPSNEATNYYIEIVKSGEYDTTFYSTTNNGARTFSFIPGDTENSGTVKSKLEYWSKGCVRECSVITATRPPQADTTTTDCSCKSTTQTVLQTWYLSKTQSSGSIPIKFQTQGTHCVPSKLTTGYGKIPCDQLRAALQKMDYNLAGIDDCETISQMYGFGSVSSQGMSGFWDNIISSVTGDATNYVGHIIQDGKTTLVTTTDKAIAAGMGIDVNNPANQQKTAPANAIVLKPTEDNSTLYTVLALLGLGGAYWYFNK
ncbi:MAG: hypothetical protein NT007_09550 [Candidatus Kapabacteria bacterium]|nr:hypothetical protein [Candidatus Kapabacteria bacterium]